MPENVLLIQVDQMHAGAMSCVGSPNVTTPNLDALAAAGTLFSHAVCNNPICMPSRISMLSGQYPSTNKQFGFSGLCDRRLPWLPRRFHDAGHRTGAFGKFHTACIGAEQWSFDVAAATAGEDENLARPHDYHYRAYCAAHGVPWPTDQIHCHNPFGPPAKPPPTATEAMHWSRQRSCRSEVPVEHSLETYTTDRCLEFMRTAAADREPFFIWLTYDRPHSPTTLPEPWFSRLRPGALELPPLPSWEEMQRLPPSYFHSLTNHAGLTAIGDDDFRFVLATYFKLIEWLDAEVGRVLQTLSELDLAATTHVVFTADHGDEAGYHGLYDKSRTVASDAVTRVPLVIRPALAREAERGQVVSAPVELVDLAPTLCTLAGVPADERFEGQDLTPTLVAGAVLDAGRAVVCEDYWKRMITSRGWKLIFDLRRDAESQLYDLGGDPQCFRNRYGDADCRDSQVELKRQLLAFLCARLHGPWSEADVDRIVRGLDPADAMLPLLTCGGVNAIQCFRAAVAVSDAEHLLLVPFWDAELMLFGDPRKYYLTSADLVPLKLTVAEALLDRAIREACRSIQPVSLWISERVHDWLAPPTPPDLDAVRAALVAAGVTL